MPYLIFTIYDMNHGENLLPRVYRISKNLTHGKNLYDNFKYHQIRRELEKELLMNICLPEPLKIPCKFTHLPEL